MNSTQTATVVETRDPEDKQEGNETLAELVQEINASSQAKEPEDIPMA